MNSVTESTFLRHVVVLSLILTTGLSDAFSCDGRKCASGTQNRCTIGGCRCQEQNATRQTYSVRTQICIPETCQNKTCATENCRPTLKGEDCDCWKNYVNVTIRLPRIQFCLQNCSDGKGCPDNYKCDNGSCECSGGYVRSFHTGECVDIDECKQKDICAEHSTCTNTDGSHDCNCNEEFEKKGTYCIDADECEEDPSVCGEHSVCENLPGNYSCQCLGGYTLSIGENSTCIPVIPAALTDPDGGNSVGVYVGVTFGVIVLLALVTAAIFIRRRRHNIKPSKPIAQHSEGHTQEHNITTNVYEDVSLDKEVSDSCTRDIKTVPREYPNAEISTSCAPTLVKAAPNKYNTQIVVGVTKAIGREAYSPSNEEHVLPNNKFQFPIPATPNVRVKFDDTDAYNTLEVLTVNTDGKPKTENGNGVDQSANSRRLISDETDKLQDSNAYFTLEDSNLNATKQLNTVKDVDDGSETIEADRASQLHDSNPYFTLEDANPNTTEQVAAVNRLHTDLKVFDSRSAAATEFNRPEGYCTLELKDEKKNDEDQNVYNSLILSKDNDQRLASTAYLRKLEALTVSTEEKLRTNQRLHEDRNDHSRCIVSDDTVHPPDSSAYFTLEDPDLNKTDQLNTANGEDEHPESIKAHVAAKLQDSNSYFTLEDYNLNTTGQLDAVNGVDEDPENIKIERASNLQVANPYFTLEDSNLNTTDQLNTANGVDEDLKFIKADEAATLQDANPYFTLEDSNLNTTEKVVAVNGLDKDLKTFDIRSDETAKLKGSEGYCTLELKDGNGYGEDQNVYKGLILSKDNDQPPDSTAYNILDSFNLNKAAK